jgi:AcrR family transcriptional regulator
MSGRQQQRNATRVSIIAAGARLVRSRPDRDWTNLTTPADGELAGVSERTVQRHFPAERHLRDAVLQRLIEESGMELHDLHLDRVAIITARMFTYLSSFAIAPDTENDPCPKSGDQQRRAALMDAVVRVTPQWHIHQQETAAAMLDILWTQPPYERLITAWGFDSARAIGALTWLIGLIEKAIRNGHRPGLNE